ncbi:MAG: hypothetical protein JWR18_482 [Segetibacter sp.]|nr:hypothetical protein [Segetibacter sp.]
MKSLLFFIVVSIFASCGNDKANSAATADSSNIITDSSALKNVDTTSVLGANGIGQSQMRTDTPVTGSNAGK